MSATRTASKLYNLDQSWHYETLWDLMKDILKYKVKVEIRRNAYDSQSYGRAWLFHQGDLQWNGVANTAGPTLKCLGISYVMKEAEVRKNGMEALEADTFMLIEEVASILEVDVKQSKVKRDA